MVNRIEIKIRKKRMTMNNGNEPMNKAGNERRERDDKEWDSLAILNCQWRLRALALEISNAILFYNSKKPPYYYTISFYNISTSQTSTFLFYSLK